jgi:hypothetical protein
MSINKVRFPLAAKAAERLIEIVVFPHPPFWFTTAIVLMSGISLCACVSLFA